MKLFWSCAALAVLCLAPAARADDPTKPPAQSFEVPYRLTVVKHIVVRAKINGKGPFNFILDTGAPALFIAPEAAKKAGIEPDKKNWGVCDRFEIEGGVMLPKARARIEKPFQLDGMNGLGLGGVELHGMIGYNILAHYRMEIDFTQDKMVWTPLADFEPKAPVGLGDNVNSAAGGLEVMGSLMKFFGALTGARTEPDYVLRGFLGVELTNIDEAEPVVKSVLADGPAAQSGLLAGDRITRIQGRSVTSVDDVHKFALKLTPGDDVKLTVKRGKDILDVSFKSGEGL
ncbi:MAG TPA: PDZ domain-containing protein [Gemmataceae bacterium]|nr:PDZ domain-containing protein [Gemmataceae bacterium]